jgi:predicted O-methyltransferase YrrM
MDELQKILEITNKDWMMSTREQLVLIGLLKNLKPQNAIEFGYHRGGATSWLSKYSEKVITVDASDHVLQAKQKFQNVEAWHLSTAQAVDKIQKENMNFDFALIDADHSRKAVCQDIEGLISVTNVIIMHDSFNPSCRAGMNDALKHQNSHAYYLDFLPSMSKEDGLWGGFAIAWKSNSPGQKLEYEKEYSLFIPASLQNFFRFKYIFKILSSNFINKLQSTISKLRILGGKVSKFFISKK